MKSIASAAFMAGGALAAMTVEPLVLTTRPPQSTYEPSLASIEAEAATVLPSSPTSNVKGASFQKFYQIWFENTDFEVAQADPNFAWLATQGITLTNYYGTTHPSQPQYRAAAAGDNFGGDNDDYFAMPSNISTVADILEYGGVSWSEYQEGLPFAGFSGFNYSNQTTYADNYVRKHNPLILFDNISNNATRATRIKSFSQFEYDLGNQTLPQWAFFTPNMQNDAHDTNITFAGEWLRSWLPQLLNNSYFMEDTLILVTFDENDDYPVSNRVFSVLLGGAVPQSLWGTTDSLYYNHFSTISTVSRNWGLPALGRWDCGANVFELVANATGYQNTNISLDGLYFNSSYPGPASDALFTPGWWPSPNTMAKCTSGKGVLPSIVETWGNTTGSFNYTNVYPYDTLSGNNVGGTPVIAYNDRNDAASAPSSTTSSSPSASASAKSAAGVVAMPGAVTLLGVAGLVAAFL